MSGIVESAGTEAARQPTDEQEGMDLPEAPAGQHRTVRSALLDAALQVFA
ncbi:MAG: hypothetical protein HOV83_24075 [Catenulispora sp.]|nr:hypothetical protein [Catenulispora sp.]